MTPPSRRKRLRPEDRRRQLVDTTLEVLARHGAQGASLRQVCRDAGVSPGLIAHFFAGWQDLVMEAYDSLTGGFTDDLAAAIEGPDPLEAVVDLYFSDDWLSAGRGDAYVALWALSRTEVDLRARMTDHYADMHAVIADAMPPGPDREGEADAFLIFLNGLWVEMILNPGHVTPIRARRMSREWLARFAIPNAKGER